MLGALPRARIRGPNRNWPSPGTYAPPPFPASTLPRLPHAYPQGHATGTRGAGEATQPEPSYVPYGSGASTAPVTARSRRPRAPPPGRGEENAGRPRSRRRADPWRPEAGATAHCARPDGRRAGPLAALAAHRCLLPSGARAARLHPHPQGPADFDSASQSGRGRDERPFHCVPSLKSGPCWGRWCRCTSE